MFDFIGEIIKAPFICCGWLIMGAIAGAVARQLMGSRDAPLLSDLILGLGGALIGGVLAALFGLYKPDGGITLVIANLVIAVVGAAVLIGLGRVLRGQGIVGGGGK